MKGRIIRATPKPPTCDCPLPTIWLTRLIHRVQPGDRWECPDYGSIWQLGWSEIHGLYELPGRAWNRVVLSGDC